METLKQIRKRLGISQAEVAKKANITAPLLSTYESGQAVPILEDAVLLERTFGCRLDWATNEKIKAKARKNILYCITVLAEHYPLTSVINFVQKAMKEGQRFDSPDKFILHYTKVSETTDDYSYLPPTTLD